jgi:hypothetical protein
VCRITLDILPFDFHGDRPDFFTLELKVEGFCTTDAFGRKSYKNGAIIKWDVEIGSFTLEMLMANLCNEVKWSSNQPALVVFLTKICMKMSDYSMRGRW